jgi:hypothetical protein
VQSAAVTVASLEGAGLDAIAGLLQSPSAPPSVAAADPQVPASLPAIDDLSALAIIGTADLDPGTDSHAHHTLPLVGTGLI